MRIPPTVTLALALVAFGAGLRFLPHPANFAPVTAIALFAGMYLPRRLALAVPLAVMVASDLVIGLHPLIPFTWGCFLVAAFIGSRQRVQRPGRLALATLGSSVLFYVVTNFAVWAFTPLYAKTLPGLVASYTMAVPFFRNALVGDLFYTALLVGTYELAARALRLRAPAHNA